jgi:hypothetical protein
MQNIRTGPGVVVDICPLRVIITLKSPSHQHQSPTQQRQDHMLLPDRGYERKSLELMKHLLDVSIES